MKARRHRYEADKTSSEYQGKFQGYRVEAWGKRQVLNAEIEIWVRREGVNPNVWCARAYPGDHAPAAIAATAEQCMAAIELQFVRQVMPWLEFRWQGLGQCQLKRWNVESIDQRHVG